MTDDKLDYDSDFWESLLPVDVKTVCLDPKNITARIHLIISLILYLAVPLKQLLHYLFSSANHQVALSAGKFISRRDEQQIPFGPSDLYQLWYIRYPKCRDNLAELVIRPSAQSIVLAESDRAISDPKLKITLSDLTVDSVRELLAPSGLEQRYRQHMLFFFNLLETFTKSPDRYQKRKGSKSTADEEESDYDSGQEDGLGRDAPTAEEDGAAGGPPSDRATVAIVYVISTLLYLRNRATNILPLIIGLFLRVGGASSRVIATLNQLGTSVSAKTIDRIKVLISEDAGKRAKDLFRSNRLFSIIFDNINIYVRKSEQRVDNQNTMIHATNIALLALPPEAAPAGEDLNAKLAMRGKRGEERNGDCIRLTKDDQEHYQKAFTVIIAQMLCAYWPGRERWKNVRDMEKTVASMSPGIRPLKAHKTETFPMGVVDVDEGSKKGVIRVLEEIQKMSSPRRLISRRKSALSREIWEPARRDRADDVGPMEQLSYIQELSELFHWALNATHMLMRVHLGNAVQDPGSLSNHKDLLGRVWDVNKPNYVAAKALLRHSLIARLLHIVALGGGACPGAKGFTSRRMIMTDGKTR
ncbi:hypothetical protein FRC04_007424 [Tulasnella sp. 424]|nr:hypothetical protein FRC04_007424 [Tulasnella sp. 424]KAG8959723.1 hypothetical protein FRC05_007587 [Tulasnella sp. 425]